jgi:serine protease Do
MGVGAGFFIHPDGYVLTSAHVVSEAQEVEVSVCARDGQRCEEWTAQVVGRDDETDMALLKVLDPTHPFPVLKLGSARHVGLADWVVVIGSPFGLAHSVSVGVVSALKRSEVSPGGHSAPLDYLQTDAAINPGNSGGPVLDLDGHVVAIANSVNVAGQGIGFAVPVDLAKRVLPELMRYGKVRRGWLGLSVEDDEAAVGARISTVAEGGPAQRAGLHVGDVIVRWGKTNLESAVDLRREALVAAVGRHVTVEVMRGQRPLTLSLDLASPPDAKALRADAQKVVPAARMADWP